ncbi:MAG: SLC13 family permease [Candidatus Hinthialibacter antarcticus]|nr:SLC13 family permease [Candidatus Hinthialibacter antarcticus]
MTFDIFFMLVLLVVLLGSLMFTRIAPDVLFLGALTVLFVSNRVDAADALSGFSNPGMITIGALYIVVCGIRETGGIAWIVQWGLGRPKNLFQAKLRLVFPVTTLSAFLNNTPVVGMFIPAVIDWAKQNNLSVSKLLIPLSYASIFGGTCTLIGTSTNLIVNGLMISETGASPFHVFSIAWVGIPSALVGLTYMFLFSDWLLPDRRPSIGAMQDPREYTVEMLVEDASPLVGRSIENAGLRNLPSLFLMEIERAGHLIPAVGPQEQLEANDRLVFVGVIDSIVDLQKIRGLTPATNQVFKLDAPRTERVMVEAVVSDSCPLVGKTIREGRFRTVYNAAVIAVARNGERINKKIGDIVLRPGDTLLLEAPPTFFQQSRDSRDFFLVSQLQDSQPLRHERGLIALLVLAAMVLSAAFNVLSMLQAAMLAAGAMIATGCCSGSTARKSIDWQVLLVIAASLGVGHALDKTGAAAYIASGFIAFAGDSPILALIIVYLITTIFTELITNNAAAVLVFPIALATANSLEVSFVPFAIAIMMAASASFSSPIGYQTNLMVYGPGGYRFSDYARVGLPLNFLLGAVTVTLAPIIWPF